MPPSDPAPAPAPGVVVDVAAESPVPGNSAVVSKDLAAILAALAASGQHTNRTLDKLVERLTEEAQDKPPKVSEVSGAELSKIIPPQMFEVGILPKETREFLARTFDATGYHQAATELRGQKWKGGFLDKTAAVGEKSIKVKHVVGFVLAVGGIVVVYELAASKMDWPRIGFFDAKSTSGRR